MSAKHPITFESLRAIDAPGSRLPSPRLGALARFVNEQWPDLEAKIEKGYCNTDRHPKGVRWRMPGKGREGSKLVVRVRGSDYSARDVFSHNAAETYRKNNEVVHWILEHEKAPICPTCKAKTRVHRNHFGQTKSMWRCSECQWEG